MCFHGREGELYGGQFRRLVGLGVGPRAAIAVTERTLDSLELFEYIMTADQVHILPPIRLSHRVPRRAVRRAVHSKLRGRRTGWSFLPLTMHSAFECGQRRDRQSISYVVRFSGHSLIDVVVP